MSSVFNCVGHASSQQAQTLAKKTCGQAAWDAAFSQTMKTTYKQDKGRNMRDEILKSFKCSSFLLRVIWGET
jgi:hypothetical protein